MGPSTSAAFITTPVESAPLAEAPIPPLVSVVVPVAGEATRIGRCLDAILAQDWPDDRLEVIVVDGAPGDGTAAQVRTTLAARPGLHYTVVENPGGGRSANLNRGLAACSGAIVCRVDARSAIPPHYLSTCVSVLEDPTVAVVGGSQSAVAPGSSAQAVGIGRALNNRLSMGMARYRRAGPSGPADTVYLGAFRRVDLEAAGGWDDSLEINEDFDLNSRLRSEFGALWFDSTLRVEYLPRQSVRAIGAQYWKFGRWKVRYLRRGRQRPRLRQAVGLLAAPGAIAALLSVAAAPPPWRRRLLAVAVAGALAGEELGSLDRGARGSPRARLWSIATCGTVVLSWSAGAWAELAAGRSVD